MSRILFVLLLLIPWSISAFSFPPLAVENPIQVTLTPTTPKPGDTVILQASSHIVDLDRSVLAWRINGAVVKGGVGETQVHAVMGVLGEPLTIQLVTESFEKNVYENMFQVYPANVVIAWDANTYAPVFFKGRSLPSPGATVTAYAVTQFATETTIIEPQALMYEWSLDGKTLPGGSGIGKSSATFTMPEFPGTYQLRVVVQTTDGKIESHAAAQLTSQSPLLSLYRDTPLLGVVRTSSLLWDPRINDAEATIAVVPYYASITTVKDKKLSYAWKFDEKPFQHDPNDPNRITLLLGDGRARPRAAVAIQHRDHILQTADHAWTINVNQEAAAANNPFLRQFDL